MVLPAPAPDAPPAPAAWLDRLSRLLRLSAGGIIVLIDRARPERLRDVVARLVDEHPETDVLLSAPELSSAPHGSTVLLRLRPEDAAWLNLGRPVVSERALRLVLWSEEATTIGLMQGAIDFYDWITARIECPTGPPAFAVNELRRVALARSPAVVWRGGDLDAVFKAAAPGRELSRVSAALPYPEIVAAMTPKPRTWIAVTDIDGRFRWRRVQWATAEARRWGRTILVEPAGVKGTDTGMLPAAGADPMGLDEAAARLAEVGLEKPARLAALLDLSPVAIGRAVAWAKRGGTAAVIEERVRAEPDLGRALPPAESETVFERAAAGAVWPRRLPDLPARARMALDAGDPVVAAHWASQWLTQVQAARGFDSEELAAALMALGQARRAQGDLASARTLLERSLQVLVRALGTDDHASVAATFHELALLAMEQGDFAGARERLERALGIWTRALGTDDNTHVAACLHTLAIVLRAQGDLAGARGLLERALGLWVRVLGSEEHPQVAASLHMLASVRHAQGDLAGARELLERALRIDTAVYGSDEHPNVAASLHALASVLWAQGDFSGAREHLEHSLRIQRKTLGTETHPSVAASLHELGRVLLAQGDLSGARDQLERSLHIKARALGTEEHADVAASLQILGTVLLAQGDLIGARDLLERASRIWLDVLGTDEHPAVAASLNELAAVLKAQGDLVGAKERYERALGIQERLHGGRAHYLTAITETNLGMLLAEMGETTRAVELLRHAHHVLGDQLGTEHPNTKYLTELLESFDHPPPATADR